MTEAEQVRQFVKELKGKYFKRFGEKELREIKSQPNAQILYSFEDGDITGLVLVSLFSSLTRRVLTIEDLIVLPQFRGKGVGTRLLGYALKLAKKNKVDCVEVLTKDDNEIALGLYKKLGFEDRKNTALRKWL